LHLLLLVFQDARQPYDAGIATFWISLVTGDSSLVGSFQGSADNVPGQETPTNPLEPKMTRSFTTLFAFLTGPMLFGFGGGTAAPAGVGASAAVATPSDSVLLWQGFKHSWDTRNHRIGRMGSWMQMRCDADGCSGTARHSATSGTAADEASFKTRYAAINAADVGIQTGMTSVFIEGDEGEFITDSTVVSVPAQDGLCDRDNTVVMLNGFDLAAVGNAKKLDHLKILVSDVECVGDRLEFDAEYSLKVDCDSLECVADLRIVLYQLDIRYAVFAGDEDGFRSTDQTINHSYEWNTRDETWLGDEVMERTLDSADQHPVHRTIYNDGTMGIRGFRINLDDDYHMMGMAVQVRDMEYDSEAADPIGGGRADFLADVFFKPWTTSMAFGAYKEAGAADNMVLYTSLLQFEDASIDTELVTGTVDTDSEETSISVSF